MYEVEVPGVGFAKFNLSDFLFAAFGLSFIVWGAWSVLTDPTVFSVGISAVQAICGMGLVWVTVVQGRRRVKWEEWTNPISQLRAFENHALAEGL